ncbi:hypothetical protein [Paraburkholderia caribensis]|uniref:hypothetical protein n=1 Tax=Paraburkholderia caribensis TaxID=75105 RepID=UPI0006D4739F|nr:hypothetical protein [Paraburkholderia caribensis]ALP66725.1 hypothetical protein AN416_26515 [Paraburkholderia caribensis]AUT55987.1 hypothetical protein C2L66_24960 [Paraburkholderia caribensis]CAG9237639.1 conserved hypothetical protein [Paraburkholderia caribensis]
MKDDAYERRTLLNNLGRVMQLTARISEMRPVPPTIGNLIERNPILEDEPLLEYLDRTMLVEDFITRSLRAFCLWPQWLLTDPLDRNAFAASVREHLFKGNRRGWKLFAARVRGEVDWFDAQEEHWPLAADIALSAPAFNEPESDERDTRVAVTDIERGYDAQATAESIEGLTPVRERGRANEQLPETRG